MIKATSEKVQGREGGHRSPSAANGLCFCASAPGSGPHPSLAWPPLCPGAEQGCGEGGLWEAAVPPGPEQEGGRSSNGAEQQQQPGCRGHRCTRDRGQALFPSLTTAQTSLPFLLRQQSLHNISCDSTSPARTLCFCESVLSVQAVKSPVAGVLGEANPGRKWVVSPRSWPLSQWGTWGKAQSSEPRTERCCPSSVPFTNTSTVEKGICQRRQSAVLFNQGSYGPSEPVATQSVQDRRGRGSRWNPVAPRQSLGT